MRPDIEEPYQNGIFGATLVAMAHDCTPELFKDKVKVKRFEHLGPMFGMVFEIPPRLLEVFDTVLLVL